MQYLSKMYNNKKIFEFKSLVIHFIRNNMQRKNMRKYLLLGFIYFVPLLLNAQENVEKNYLIGAVPEVNGKVLFNQKIAVDERISADMLFELVEKWAKGKFAGNEKENPQNRIIIVNPEDKFIFGTGVTPLVFKHNAFVFDRAYMNYQLSVQIEDNLCNIAIGGMTIEYEGFTKSETAENFISDKVALKNKGTEMKVYNAKFRRTVIDSVDYIFSSLDTYLNGKKTIEAQGVIKNLVAEDNRPVIVTKLDQSAKIPETRSEIAGFEQLQSPKIPEDLISDRMLIVSGKDKISVMPASWGGQGEMLGKTIVYSVQNPKHYSKKVLEDGETYTLMFFSDANAEALNYFQKTNGKDDEKIKTAGLTKIATPTGTSAFSEAILIIECKKLITQQASTPKGDMQMYTGEILNVWVKNYD